MYRYGNAIASVSLSAWCLQSLPSCLNTAVHPYHDRCTAISSGNSHPASLYVPYRYDNGNDPVQEGVYRIVDEKGRIGYADEHGNTLIEPRFAFGFPFENGKAKVTDTGEQKEVPGSDGEYHYWESDDWYYINRKGQRIE